AARIGFEFDSVEDLLNKVREEIQELQEATSPEHKREEMGDVLFIVAKVARWLNIDAEEALREANRKFRRRFQKVEEIMREEGRTIGSYSSGEWEELWEKVKE
ncbi:MAG TPA: nucleoside triphosphate pyrophosphohydrolase, partial [Ktedonobacter sp.]|nr:nucleoside triphosphate pyrophosphohydrolase [Ktedonobacter sp.]